MTDHLERLVQAAIAEVKERRNLELPDPPDAPRPFVRTLLDRPGSLIAEVKRKSPSRGAINPGLAGESARWASASPAAATIVRPIFRAMCGCRDNHVTIWCNAINSPRPRAMGTPSSD